MYLDFFVRIPERQAANLREFHASVSPRFEGRFLDFMDKIPDFMENFSIIILMWYIEKYTGGILSWNP